uniref:Uncharacterized protein n=1 Tax=Hyaloperonospora arabidopsidis (strain Emoy2) TaxID=559515 RepID=M4B5N2_HYAAE
MGKLTPTSRAPCQRCYRPWRRILRIQFTLHHCARGGSTAVVVSKIRAVTARCTHFGSDGEESGASRSRLPSP